MSNINVNRSLSDQFYRYKMPKLLAKVEGKGNGIKTVVVNMVEVAKALNRPPTYPTKYFGCELGAQTQCDLKNERFIVNGSHEAAKLQDLLDGFIKRFVLCPSCDNPETVLNVLPKKGVINTKCIACGYSGQLDSTHKLTTFILKNPPGQDSTKSTSSTKKGKRKSKDDKTPKRQQNGEDNGSHSPQHDSDFENGSPEKGAKEKEIEERLRREKLELEKKQEEERLSNLRNKEEKPVERPATNWREREQMKKESWGPREDRKERTPGDNESRDWRTKAELPPREDTRDRNDWKKSREESGGSWRREEKPLYQRPSYREEPRRDGSRERKEREPEPSNWRSGGGSDKFPPRSEPDSKRYPHSLRDKDRSDGRGMGGSNYSRDRDSFRRDDPLDRRGKDRGGFSSRGDGGGFGSRNESAGGGPRRSEDKAPESSWRSGAPVGSWRDGGRREVDSGPERKDGPKTDSYRRDRPRDPDDDGFVQVRR